MKNKPIKNLSIFSFLHFGIKTLLDLVFPFFCICCQKKTSRWICDLCLTRLTLSHRCEKCLISLDVEGTSCVDGCDNIKAFPNRAASLFEKEETIAAIVKKMGNDSFHPIAKVLSSYLIYRQHQLNWPKFTKIITIEKDLKALEKEFVKRQKKISSENKNVLILLKELPIEGNEELLRKIQKITARNSPKEVYVMAVCFDQDSK